jgi:hypothetical protein
MKKIVMLLFVGTLIYGCGNSESANQVNAGANQEINKQKEKERRDSINNVLKGVQVKIYNHGPLIFDSEGWCMNDGETINSTEVKDYNSSKAYKCEEGNYIQKLVVEGNAKDIDIRFSDVSGKIIKEFKKINIDKSLSYSDFNYKSVNQEIKKNKDEFYHEWFTQASKIELLYADSIFYSATWNSKGFTLQY